MSIENENGMNPLVGGFLFAILANLISFRQQPCQVHVQNHRITWTFSFQCLVVVFLSRRYNLCFVILN